jgi:predicted ABC-type exoprotein transport system permease subunit
MPVSILELKSSAKGDFTAEAQISQRKIVYCPTQTYASLHIEPHFVSGILCTLSVSAVHYSHTMQTAPPPIWRRAIAISTAKTPIGRILLRLMLKPGEVQRTILDFFS